MTLNPEFKSLCQRWREKAQQYDTEDTHQLFDKFFSLYVAYNALYAETAAYLHRKAINQLKILISKQSSFHFWICLDPVFGEPQEDEDEKLIKRLNSSSTDERARAILQLIYQVRCNMFHGRKSVSPVQKQLLIPLIIILEKIIDKLYRKLEGASYI